MSKEEIILRLMTAVTSLWIVRRFWGIFFQKKKISFLSVLFYVLYFIYQLSFQVDSGNVKVSNIFISLFLMFFIGILGYDCKGREKYFLLMIFCCVWILVEFICYVLLILTPVEPEHFHELGTITSKILMVVTVFLLSVYWQKRNYRYLPGIFYFYLLLVPAGSIWIIVIQYFGMKDIVDFAVVLGILLIFNVVVFEMYVKMGEAYGEKMEQEVMQRQVAMYQNEFEIIKESDKNIHLLRHDLKNHMLLLAKYLEKGEYEEAKNYANEIAQETGTAGEYVRTGNSGVDSIVNYMLSKAEKLGVRSRVTIQVPETPFMPDFDLTMLLSNLLENALDALEKTELKTLDLFMNYNKQVLYISVCNTFDGNVRKRGEMYLTTKEEKGEHGLGIAAIQRIVEKYHGEIKMEHTEKMFGTDITLYVSEDRGEP